MTMVLDTESWYEDDPPSYKRYEEEGYPSSAPGSCLVVGSPPVSAQNEAIPVDLLRSVLFVVLKTRANLGRQIGVQYEEHQSPFKNTRIEVAGAIPRRLTGRNEVDARDALSASGIGKYTDEELRILHDAEQTRADVIFAIKGQFLMDDLKVMTMTEKLQEPPTRADLLQALATAQANFDTRIWIQKPGDKNPTCMTLRNALVECLPQWFKFDSSSGQPFPPELIEQRASYVLFELLWIIRKIIKRDPFLFFHYFRERRYLPLVEAYMKKVLRYPPEESGRLLSTYVKMPREIDGLRLTTEREVVSRRPEKPEKAEERRCRMGMCESYRVAEKDKSRRVLLYPPDSVKEMREKIFAADVTDESRWEYFRDMIISLLRMVIDVQRMRATERRNLRKVLPNGILDDEANISGNSQRLLEAFHELVIRPVSIAIEDYRETKERVRMEKQASAVAQSAAPQEIVASPVEDENIDESGEDRDDCDE